MALPTTNNPSTEKLRSGRQLTWGYTIAMLAFCVSLGCEKRTKATTVPSPDVHAPEATQVFRRKIEPHPQTEDFKFPPSKDQTLCVLAFDSLVRENLFTSSFYGIGPDQVELVRDIVQSYELEYARLRNERSTILENAYDGDETETALNNVSVKTLLLGRQIRRRIKLEVLTEKQRDSYNKELEDEMKAAASEGVKQL